MPDYYKPPTSLAQSYANYTMPRLDLLSRPDLKKSTAADELALRETQSIIIKTLASFGIDVTAGNIAKGPTITRYEFYPSEGLRVSRIAKLEADLARATKTERINILAPIPGKETVGIELPNSHRIVVTIRELLEDDAFQHGEANIPLALGKDVCGNAIVADLACMPNLIVAGATGDEISVCFDSIVTSLLYRFAPDELRLIMIDPEGEALHAYKNLPHLALPVVTDLKQTVRALQWVVNEMERRYALFAGAGCRHLDAYKWHIKFGFKTPVEAQGKIDQSSGQKIPEAPPYIVVIINELEELMQTVPADIELAICRIAQKARWAGIHLIIATESPRADVITGLIKANIPCRAAFQVSSALESRIIMDRTGADKLAGKGDMLYLPPGTSHLVRVQGSMVSDDDLRLLVEHCCRQGMPLFDSKLDDDLIK